ncbi:MAG TPA: hypothetical protein VGC07_08090 [Granulicella sp.]
MSIQPYPVVEVMPLLLGRERIRLWVAHFGVNRLARSLAVDRRMIHRWTTTSNPIAPNINSIRKLIALSTLEPLEDGPLSYDDFFGEVTILKQRTESSQVDIVRPSTVPRTPLIRRHQ